MIIGNIGLTYSSQRRYPEALEYYYRALKMQQEIGNKSGEATVCGSIATLYQEQSDYPKALEFNFKALKAKAEC